MTAPEVRDPLCTATLAEAAVRARRGQCRTDARWYRWCNAHESRRPVEAGACQSVQDEVAAAAEVLDTSLPLIRAAVLEQLGVPALVADLVQMDADTAIELAAWPAAQALIAAVTS